MKTSSYFLIVSFLIALGSFNAAYAQTINWRSLQSGDTHILNVNAGWDYGTTVGLGYGYKLNTPQPLILGVEFSVPGGETVFDDFKTKIGGQIEIVRLNHFSTSLKVQGIFRRYESDLVRLSNFGAEFSSSIGYYRSRWFAAAELTFDKSVVTHIRHSRTMESNYPEIQSGWFIPTGGNLSYGVVAGYSFSKIDLYLKAGKILTQDFKTQPTLPMYLQLGLNKKL